MTAPRLLGLRSLAVSLLTTLLDFSLFAACTLVLVGGTALCGARWICGAVGACCNFLLNRVWAFDARSGSAWSQAARYAITAAVSVTLGTILFALLRLITGWDARVLHLASMGLVWACFSFPLLRGWVFRRHAL